MAQITILKIFTLVEAILKSKMQIRLLSKGLQKNIIFLLSQSHFNLYI